MFVLTVPLLKNGNFLILYFLSLVVETKRGIVMKDLVREAIEKSFQSIYFEVHAIYEPEEHGWYTAAVDLFQPGMTFRVYFTLTEDQQIQVENAERWFMG